MHHLLLVFTLVSASVLVGCRAPMIPADAPEAGPWCNVGVISPSDSDEVERLLHRCGILGFSEGSVVYGVFVRQRFVGQARDLIDSMRLSYWRPSVGLHPYLGAR